MTGDNFLPIEDHQRRTDRQLVGGVVLLTGIVGAVVLIVSSYYLHQYGVGAGMKDWLAWSLVVALDVGGAGGALVWVVSNGPAKAWGRAIAVANLAASITGNVLGHLLEAKAFSPGPWLQILTGVVYPAELFAMIHLALVFRAERAPQPATVEVDLTANPAEAVPVEAVAKAEIQSDPVPVATVTPSPAMTAPSRKACPTPAVASKGLTPELLARARKLRDARASDGLRTGRRVLVAELRRFGMTDGLARKALAALDQPTTLKRSEVAA
jgi:hypothetical protein